jgi:hypothetical protein
MVLLVQFQIIRRGRRGRDRMVVGFTHVHIDADVREKLHTYTEVLHTSNIILK